MIKKTREQDEQKPQKKKGQRRLLRLSAMLFFGCIVVFCVVNTIKGDKGFSEQENRMLTQRPQLSLNAIASGRFMKQYESYKADQFLGRDFMVSLKANLGLMMGERESNGIFSGSDGYLLEDIAVPNKAGLKENLDAIQKFQSEHTDIPTYMMLVPNAANILKEKLPALASVDDQSARFEEVKETLGDAVTWIDVEKALKKHKDEKIYYRTDHHWTTLGAYYAFQEAANVFGIKENRLVSMKPHAVTDSFNGTLSADSGYRSGDKEPIYIYLPEEDTAEVVINYVEEQKKKVSMYDSSKLKEKDKYAVFFGGNTGLMDIKTTSNAKERLLLFKDSYANCFIPFLTSYYREIVVVDPRYYYGDINDLMSEYSITQTMFLYNGNTFFADNSISGVLNSDK